MIFRSKRRVGRSWASGSASGSIDWRIRRSTGIARLVPGGCVTLRAGPRRAQGRIRGVWCHYAVCDSFVIASTPLPLGPSHGLLTSYLIVALVWVKGPNGIAQPVMIVVPINSPDDPGESGTQGGSFDPLEEHHLFPQAQRFQAHWKRLGIDWDNPAYKIKISRSKHRLKPDGVHTGEANWNSRWDDFFAENPNATIDEVFAFLDQLMREFQIAR
ncbi:MAG: DUF2380 domain-containing protein [Chloroflexota bacterium]